METINLHDLNLFNDKGPHAEPLHVDPNARAILFALKPEQSIRQHNVPSSPFHVVVLSGRGVFTGSEGKEQIVGPNTFLFFDPAEEHSVRALDELVFVGFLNGAPGAQR